MPRIRTIKPEFWTDGAITDLSMAARLMFIGSWNFALCDRGHVADDPRRLKMQVLPADDVDASALIEELITSGRMDRITAPDGRCYLHIRRFTDHQKIEKRWNPRCPACDSLGLNEPRRTSLNLAEPPASPPDLSDPPPTSDQEGKGREGKGGEGKEIGPRKRGTRLHEGWIPDDDVRIQMKTEFPNLDFRHEHSNFTDHFLAAPGQRGVKMDWNATWRKWIRTAATEYGSRRSQPEQLPTSKPWTPEPPPTEIADDPEACDRWYRDQAAKREAS